jgi:serine/threonine protein phosphatase PrpC
MVLGSKAPEPKEQSAPAPVDRNAASAADVPSALPLATQATADEPVPEAQPIGLAGSPTDGVLAAAMMDPNVTPAEEAVATAQAPGRVCVSCRAPRVGNHPYCDNCGLVFPPDEEPAAAGPVPAGRLKGRYALGSLVSQRNQVFRYSGLDFAAGTPEPLPVVIVRQPGIGGQCSGVTDPGAEDSSQPQTSHPYLLASAADGEELLPNFEEPDESHAITQDLPPRVDWPDLSWEHALLITVNHPVFPAVLDCFSEEGSEYLIEEVPAGRTLWDAWDDPEATAEQRFTWLRQLAEGLHRLHQAGAVVEALRPDIVVVTPAGQTRLADVSDLLPLPLPPNPPLRATLYTAPELVLSPELVDARAELYGFGAMLHALHLGRELTEMDFEREGVPKPFLPQFPDAHPLLGRLISKTFRREPEARFPSDEAAKEDATGFTELIRTLSVCGHTLDSVRLEIAAWTTTGMVRTGNEDTFALLHAIEARQDELGESALVLLADGMGGYEAGEVAAALAVHALRAFLLRQKPFALLAGDTPSAAGTFDMERCRDLIRDALQEANRQVFTAARSGVGRRGMGCTAEVVYVHGRHFIVGHVGDSRTYHLHQGKLVQVTRDHTLVNRLVELGTLTPEEAETHPRRSELQQAIGGHAEVEPAIYEGTLLPRDWIVVCSDGLSNHVTVSELQHMLQTEATSAEMAARRLVNFANIKGAADNATVVVLRAT